MSGALALTGEPADDLLADIVVIDEVATIGGSDAFFDFADKPDIVIHKALNRLAG